MPHISWLALIFSVFLSKQIKAKSCPSVRCHFLSAADLRDGSSRHPPVGLGPGVVKCAIRELGSTSPIGLREVPLIC